MAVPSVVRVEGGEALRQLRERLGLTLREVETASMKLADRHRNDAYSISISRLSDIETKGVTPTIFRLYTLATIYRLDIREVLAMYGIQVDAIPGDLDVAPIPRTQKSTALDFVQTLRMPMQLDPQFDPKFTTDIARMIVHWGAVPMTLLEKHERTRYAYGYIGTDDAMMYPLLLPGCFVQVDTARTQIERGRWASEYERPIYFLETRDGYVCSWCSADAGNLTVVPHPLSSMPGRVLRMETDVDVIGQVVGIAMRLDDRLVNGGPTTKAPSKST